MVEKVTEMKVKVVDLQCTCCYKKVKKILCKFPEIRDQVYDEKNNIVKIVVVSCSPEKIRNKLRCKYEKLIKDVDIVEPQKPPQKVTEPGNPSNPGVTPEKKKKQQPETETKIEIETKVTSTGTRTGARLPDGDCCQQCYEGYPGGPCYHGYGRFVPLLPCYGNCGYGYGYGRSCSVRQCDYFCEEYSSACSIM